MEPERWQRINAIFDLAIDLDASLRERCVRQAAAGDEYLAEEVLALLRAGAESASLPSPMKAASPAAFSSGLTACRSQDFPQTCSTSATTTDQSNGFAGSVQASSEWSGKKIGNYQVLETIGRGGMGVVYRAYDELRHRFVALKTLQSTRSATLGRFKLEFRIFTGLSHPNLVSLYELVSEGEHWFFTMELVEGKSLLDYIGRLASRDDGLERARIQRLRNSFRQLADAVNALHSADKLHRDLKPSNVLVTPEPRVVLLDFGLGVELNSSGIHENTEDNIIGSIPYMSPEQVGAGTVSAASDWYSLGVILHEALTGHVPFEGSPLDILRLKGERDGSAPSRICPDVPEDLNDLCVDLLRRAPDRRPNSVTILKRLGVQVEGATATPSAVLPKDAAFVGRGPELQLLRDSYVSSRRKPILIYVKGHSGSGKTSLVQRFLTEIPGESQAVILTGRCLEQESVPFKALDSLIDCLVRQLQRLNREQLDSIIPRDIRVLARVFPALWQIPGIQEAPSIGSPNPDPAELRHRAAATLRELLARLADRYPLILFIDDLQWGDRDSASLLSDIMTPPYAPNFLGIGCYRTEDVAGSPFLQALEEFRRREPLPYEERHIAIGELDPHETRELARRILGARNHESDALVDAIAHESTGRPFLVYELVEHLQGSPERLLSTGPLALNDALWRRVERLPEHSRYFLELVAVAGRPIGDIDVFKAAALGTADAAVVPALKAARLIRGTPAGAANYIEVYHDRVREVVLQHLAGDSLESHHRRLARILADSERADPELLAYHLSRGGMPDAAAEHYVTAAAKAADALAFDHAVRLYRQALSLKSWAVDQQCTLRTQLGEALNNAGRGAEAATEYLAAASYTDPELALDLRHRASLALLTSGHVDEGLLHLHPVMESVGTRLASTPWRALVSLLVGRTRLRFRGTQFNEKPEHSVSPNALRRIDIGWSVVLGLSVIDPIRGADFQTRSLLLALEAGEPFRVARALAVEAAHLASSGDINRAKSVLAEAERLSSRLQHPYTSAIVELARGAIAYFDERWRDSLQFCRGAAATFRLHCTGAIWEIDTANAFTLWSLAKMGSIAELSRVSPGLLKEARDRGDLYATTNVSTQIMTLVRLAADDPQGALTELNLIMSQWSQNGYHVQHHDALLAFVPVELYVGDPEAAWNRVQAEWKAFRRSLLSHVQDLRIEMLQLRSFCALAMAAKSKKRSRFIALAENDARRLLNEALPWTFALHDYIMGAVAFLRGNWPDARARLASAVSEFDRVDSGLQAAATRRRLADLSSGQEADVIRDAADTWLRDEGVANPERLVDAYAPGFPS